MNSTISTHFLSQKTVASMNSTISTHLLSQKTVAVSILENDSYLKSFGMFDEFECIHTALTALISTFTDETHLS
jgi:hypothetical protein